MKNKIYTLLQQMSNNKRRLFSSETISWHAHRKAEKLHDERLLPVLKEIIEENDSVTNIRAKETRKNAYFVIARLLKNKYNCEYCSFLIKRVTAEKDGNIISNVLFCIGDLSNITDLKVEPIIELCRKRKDVRMSALHALGAFKCRESIEELRYWAGQTDEKKYKRGTGDGRTLPLSWNRLRVTTYMTDTR